MVKFKKTETLVGIFLILGLILVGLGVVYFGDFRSKDRTRYPIRIMYRDAGGLIKGSNVRLGGANIGMVSSSPVLTESGDSVVLEIRLDNDIHIQRGSEFRIDMQNLLGDKYIDVIPPAEPNSDFIDPNELVIGHSESDLSKIRANALIVSTELANLLKKLDANSDNLIKTVDEISIAAHELSESTRRINEGVLSEKNIAHLESFLSNLDQSGRELPGMMGEAKASLSEFKAALGDSRKMMAKANEKLDALDEGLSLLAPAVASFKVTADNMASVTKNLNNGKGTLGMLFKDEKFRKEFETFIRNLRDYGILRYRNPNEPEPLIDPRAGYSGSRR